MDPGFEKGLIEKILRQEISDNEVSMIRLVVML